MTVGILKQKKLKRILLIRTDRIGDVILTTPVVSILKQHYPDLHITFAARTYTKQLLENYPDIDEILLYQPENRHRGIAGHLQFAKELRERNFDAALLFYPRPALAMVIKLAKIPIRIGVGYRWYSLLLNQRIFERRKHGAKHELEHNLTLLKPLIPKAPANIRFNFRLSQTLKNWRHNQLERLGTKGRYAIIHPGNGGSAPNLSNEQYQFVCRKLLKYSSLTLLFTGSSQEKQRVQNIIGEFGNKKRLINAAGIFDIAELMAIISQASLFIASSTGPLHIANAFGIPLIAFYCPGLSCSPRRWGPYHQQEWVTTPQVIPCRHCRIDKCPNGNCVEKIPFSALEEVLVRRLNSAKLFNA